MIVDIPFHFHFQIVTFCSFHSIKKSSGFSLCFRGISRLGPAFIVLQRFELAHIDIQGSTFQKGCKRGTDQEFF